MRTWIGGILIKAGVKILPAETRRMVIGMLAYHIPGALPADEKAWVRKEIAEVQKHRKANA